VLAQELAATSVVVEHLTAEWHMMVESPRGDGQGWHQQGGLPPQPSRPPPGRPRIEDEVSFHRSSLPKMSFPKFTSENPRIWIDKCYDYFHIFNIPECMWTIAASLHMEENVAKWLHVYKLKVRLGNWRAFVAVVEEKFGAFDYRKAVHDLLGIRQEGSVEEYTKEFETIQFQVSMFNSGFDDMIFTSHFINGLKDDIRAVVQSHMPQSLWTEQVCLPEYNIKCCRGLGLKTARHNNT
jgi:hypothetical protein